MLRSSELCLNQCTKHLVNVIESFCRNIKHVLHIVEMIVVHHQHRLIYTECPKIRLIEKLKNNELGQANFRTPGILVTSIRVRSRMEEGILRRIQISPYKFCQLLIVKWILLYPNNNIIYFSTGSVGSDLVPFYLQTIWVLLKILKTSYNKMFVSYMQSVKHSLKFYIIQGTYPVMFEILLIVSRHVSHFNYLGCDSTNKNDKGIPIKMDRKRQNIRAPFSEN